MILGIPYMKKYNIDILQYVDRHKNTLLYYAAQWSDAIMLNHVIKTIKNKLMLGGKIFPRFLVHILREFLC